MAIFRIVKFILGARNSGYTPLDYASITFSDDCVTTRHHCSSLTMLYL